MKLLRHPYLFVSLAAVALLALALASYEQPAEIAGALARTTARLSLAVFFLAFTASSWHRLAPGPWSVTLLQERRAYGLAFAYAHTIHLAAFTSYFWLSGHKPSPVSLIAGGGAYVAMYALALTSNDAAVKRLGARAWKRLHRFGVYYLWLIFFLSYLPRALQRSPSLAGTAKAVLLLALVLGMMAVRLVARGNARRAVPAATA